MRVPSVEPSHWWWVAACGPRSPRWASVSRRPPATRRATAGSPAVALRSPVTSHGSAGSSQPRRASALRRREAAEAPSQWALATPKSSPVRLSVNRQRVTMRGIGLPQEREPGVRGVSENQFTVHASRRSREGR